MKTRPFFQILSASVLLLISSPAIAGKPYLNGSPTGLAKTTSNDFYRPMLINNVFNYYGNNGDGAYNKFSTDNQGFEWPKGSNKHVVFEDGIVWGCQQAGVLKAGGSMYRRALQAGPILIRGTNSTAPVADDPANPANRIYRVRRDITPITSIADPADPKAAGELAVIQNSEIPYIGRYEPMPAAQILQQYWDDWKNWPATQGAPFTDVDHDGVYDPAIDVPGVPFSDQTLWYAANDLDSLRIQNLSGSLPIGLEMQKTIWAYNTEGPLAQTIVSRTRILNKSGVPLDSMFIMQFVDPDLGEAGDDFVGCDTLLNLGYAYNGQTIDATYGTNPPAVGYRLLQGPVVHGVAGDTAIFGGAYRPGFKNLPMTAFVFFTSGLPAQGDPAQGPGGDIQLYRLMHCTSARNGAPFVDPTTNQVTKFVFPGDPVKATDGSAGWVDGMGGLVPYDRRFCVISGPFSMSGSDTQEVVVACIVGQGTDRLSSITVMKNAAAVVGLAFKGLETELPPGIVCSVTRSIDKATVTFRADAQKILATAVTMNLKTYADSTVGSVTLLDDGLRGDGAAGDGIFGGTVQITQQPSGLNAEAVVSYPNGQTLAWPRVIESISTTKLAVSAYSVVSDNINNDGIANPGENVRYVFSLTNESSLSFANLTVMVSPHSYFYNPLTIPSLAGNATSTLNYDANDPKTYMVFDVPPQYVDSTFIVEVLITDQSHNTWKDALEFPVSPLHSVVYRSPLTRITGTAPGDFDVLIVDSSKVRNHLYVIRGVEPNGEPGGYSVKDSATGVCLIQDHALPDDLGHTSPIVDGFKLLLGTVNAHGGMQRWSIPQGTRRFSPAGGFVGLGLEGFGTAGDPLAYDMASGTIGSAGNFRYGGIQTSLKLTGYRNVLLRLAAVNNLALWDPKATPTDENYTRGYRYLRAATAAPADSTFVPWIINKTSGYPYQDYNYAVPFSAWDMETNPPTRLSVGLMENNAVGGKVDGRYWPGISTVDNSLAREMCFIFATPYSDTPDPALQIDMQNSITPMMWVMTCARRAETAWAAGDQFLITAYHLPTPADAWTFNPSIVLWVKNADVPSVFSLSQNYPNPFNPTTTITYAVPMLSTVRLTVFDLLAREVALLVNGRVEAGMHSVAFSVSNLASGVYFYRIDATASSGKRFTQTKKMLVLR